jgi:hypothetical protein
MNKEETSLEEFAQEKKERIDRVSGEWSAETIEKTAADLERVGYDPLFLIDVKGFVRFTAAEAKAAIDRILAKDDARIEQIAAGGERTAEELKRTTIGILASQYELLERLRAEEPEAWDEIHELYEDD